MTTTKDMSGVTTAHFEAPAQGWSPLDSLSRLGIGLISFFARVSDSSAGSGGKATGETAKQAPSASATPATSETSAAATSQAPEAFMACCNLAFPNGPFCPYIGWRRNYYCPPGWYRQWWYCCQGTQLAGCGECTQSSTCWQGPFNCSTWWWEFGGC